MSTALKQLKGITISPSQLFYSEERWEEAIGAALKEAENANEAVQAQLHRTVACAHCKLENYREARNSVLKAISMPGISNNFKAELFAVHSYVLGMLNRESDAEMAAQNGLDLFPENPECRGWLYLRLSEACFAKDVWKAREAVEKGLALPLSNRDLIASLCYWRSQSLLKINQPQRAAEAAKEGIKAKSSNNQINGMLIRNLTTAYNEQKQYDWAIQEGKKGLQIKDVDPLDKVLLLQQVAIALFKRKKFEETIDHVMNAIGMRILDPEINGYLYYLFARALDELGRYQSAEDIAKTGLKWSPLVPSTKAILHNQISEAQYSQNKFEDAEKSAREALKLAQDTELKAHIYDNLSLAILAQNRFQEARKMANEGLFLQFEDRTIRESLLTTIQWADENEFRENLIRQELDKKKWSLK